MRQLLRSFVMFVAGLVAAGQASAEARSPDGGRVDGRRASGSPASDSRAADSPMSPHALHALLDGAAPPLVIDTRTPEEYAAGHVPGAVLVPHDAIEAHLALLAGARDRDIVLYCRSGRRSGLAEEALRSHGFTRLRQLDGSWLAWEAAGLPAATGDPAASDLPPNDHPAPKDEP